MLSQRFFLILFQIALLLAAVKIFQVDKYLTETVFGPSPESREYLTESRSREQVEDDSAETEAQVSKLKYDDIQETENETVEFVYDDDIEYEESPSSSLADHDVNDVSENIKPTQVDENDDSVDDDVIESPIESNLNLNRSNDEAEVGQAFHKEEDHKNEGDLQLASQFISPGSQRLTDNMEDDLEDEFQGELEDVTLDASDYYDEEDGVQDDDELADKDTENILEFLEKHHETSNENSAEVDSFKPEARDRLNENKAGQERAKVEAVKPFWTHENSERRPWSWQENSKKTEFRRQTENERKKDEKKFSDRKETREDDRTRRDIDATCRMQLVETVPRSLIQRGLLKKLPVTVVSIYEAWQSLITGAKTSIDLVSQWGVTKRGRGVDLYSSLKSAAKDRGVDLRIVFTKKFARRGGFSPIDLRKEAGQRVKIRLPSIEKKIDGKTRGIIHSKMMIVDRKHVYVGSANFGTRCTSFTKEVGILISDCPIFARDAEKQYEIYWNIDGDLPKAYPKHLSTKMNSSSPLKIFNPEDETLYKIYLGSSPIPLCAEGRTDDLSAILNLISRAEKFIFISVNEYIAMDLYKDNRPWTVIDDEIRKAVVNRGVSVKFLCNDKATDRNWMIQTLRKLLALNAHSKRSKLVEAKLFTANAPRFHGSHNKILITEKAGYLGTSNWSEDYFTTTAGLGFVFEPVTENFSRKRKFNIRDQLELIFLRDFYSELARPIY